MEGYEAGSVTVEVDGELISVKIDPYYGPQPYRVGGHPPGPNDSILLPIESTENGIGAARAFKTERFEAVRADFDGVLNGFSLVFSCF